MEKVFDFVLANWESISGIGLAVVTLFARLYPTQKNWDIVGGTLKTLDKIIPNLKRNKDDGSITRHCVIWLLFLLPLFASGQNNVFMKGANSYNVSDTSFQQNNRSALQTLYGNTGNFYFDKARNKWRIWAGTCATCTVDSAYVDLLNPGASGFANPMTTLGDIITGGSSGTPQRLGVGSNGQSLTVSGGVPSWQTPTVYTSNNGITKTGSNFAPGGDISSDWNFISSTGASINFGDGFDNIGNFSVYSVGEYNFTSSDNTVSSVPNQGWVYGSDPPSPTTGTLISKNYADTHLRGATFTNTPSNGNVPTFNGTNWTFSTPTTAPAGSNTQIQFNNSGAFGASADFTWSTNLLSVGPSGNQVKIDHGTSTHPQIYSQSGATLGLLIGTQAGALSLSPAGDLSLQAGTNLISITGNIDVDTNVNSSAGDSATENVIAGRFRKDTSGSVFTLTNSYVTANSIIIVTRASAPLTQQPELVVVAGSGSFTVTWYVAGVATAPDIDTDINFHVFN